MLSFLNNGPNAMPALIVMRLLDADNLDPNYNEIVVLIYADHKPMKFSDASLSENTYRLHPVFQNSADSVVRGATYEPSSGTFTIPALTSAVFVLELPALQLNQPVSLFLSTVVIMLIAGLTYLLTARFLRRRQIAK